MTGAVATRKDALAIPFANVCDVSKGGCYSFHVVTMESKFTRVLLLPGLMWIFCLSGQEANLQDIAQCVALVPVPLLFVLLI